MRRLISLLAVISAAALSLVALTSHPARTQGTEPVPALRLDADGYTLGELVEGDAPPLERFHPDVLPARDHPVTVDGLRAPEGYTGTFRDYLTSAEIARFLAELAADHPTLLEVVEIGRSALGRPILAARVASSEAPGAIEDRPAIYVDGQHHSREMVTSQVVLYTVWWLLDRYGQDPLVTHIVDTRVTWLVPSVNPDGNDIALHDDQTARKTANPRACDDDGDGRFDEDPVRDYGYGTHTLTAYHFDPAWADAHVDDPFVADWFRHLDRSREPEELGRFTGALGGPMLRIPATDADGDRRFNEDDLGGTDPNRNYDFEWQEGDPRCRSDGYRGETAFSEAETQAVRDFVGGLSHLSTALSYHSGVDIILHPWGYSRTAPLPDAWLFERLGRKGSQLTEANGFPGSPHAWAARGLYDATGSTMDYLYGKLGAYALSPEVYGASSRTYLARLGATGTFTVGTSTGVSFNPRPDELLATTERWNRFALYLLAATPNVELVALAVEGDDLVATVGNDGALPVDVQLELVDADGVTRAARDPTRLWAEAVTTTWRIPLADLPAAAPIELRMRAVQPAATVAHEVERATWAFTLRGGAVELAPGSAGPLADLATHFPDGWWADERWDEPDRYHLPGSMPLPIDPPTPTPVSASATPAPATATPVSPTPDSSVTPEPAPTPTATAFPTPTASPPEPTPTPTSSPAPSATAPPTSPAVRGAAWLPVAFR